MTFGDTLTDAITPWIHVLAVTVWVGPQFMMFVAAIPAVRTIEDRRVRAKVMRTIVTRFGWLAWAAMAVIILTGISNIFQVQDIDPNVDIGSTDIRWFHWFSGKMLLVGVMMALTAVHTFVIGPRQLALNEKTDVDEAEAARLRRMSMIISGSALLLSIVVILFAMILSDHGYTFTER
ncbi:MAG: DUF4149 domain-containing protein [Chloroflexi bacterium]|nr:DUF4149 domain-containing protein [Chloroflexota bacterium]